ncbi:MAG: GAF domain-containing protein [Abitibacteriaceae bacterium]|nr:GAF domain-containing protein [Abditibacteriaceae bacterium]
MENESKVSSSFPESAPKAGGSVTRGTLVDAVLPGAAFHPDDFDVELSQTSLAEADELLKATLDEAMVAVGGTRAFLALVDTLSGELVLRFTAGDGWTENIRRLRVNVRAWPHSGLINRTPVNTTSNSEATTPPADEPASAPSENGTPADLPESFPSLASLGTRQGITRHVVINGRRYWTGDVQNDPYYIGFFADVKSEVAVPITARGGGTIGVINIESTEHNAFNEEHANLLAILARRAAVIIAMAEHQLREEALIAIGRDFNSTADVDTIMEDVVQQATKILRADDCSLFVMDEETDMLRLTASHGPLHEAVGRADVRYVLGEGLTGWVAQHGEVIRVGDPRTDPRWKGLFEEAPAGEVAAVMAVPVLTQRSKPGVLRVVRHRKGSLYFLPQEFTQADEDVLVTLAGQLAVAIDRTRLTRRLLSAERMAAWGEMSARSAHMIGNTVFGIKGHLNELSHLLQGVDKDLEAHGRAKPPRRVNEHDAELTPDPATSEKAPHQVDTVAFAASVHEARLLSEHITRGIYRLEEILGEFRDFVLATQLHTTQSDINQILRTVTAESFPKHSDIDLVLNLAPKLPPIMADEVKLKRAFSELIENSIDFQPQGGMLAIRTSLADETIVRTSGASWARNAARGPILQIEFIDHGPGLSDQDRERVFTPFYTRKAKGMGLGLSIVKGIIEAHRGIIKEVGDADIGMPMGSQGRVRGAHFLILLPADTPANGSNEAASDGA